jgi:hypothetical protein
MALLLEDPNSRVTYPVLKTPDLAFGGRVCDELGHTEELQWASRW